MHWPQVKCIRAQIADTKERINGSPGAVFVVNCGSLSMNNVVQLPVVTTLDLNADTVLESLVGKLEGFVLAGWDKEGNEFFTSTFADGGEVLWLIERLKLALLNN